MQFQPYFRNGLSERYRVVCGISNRKPTSAVGIRKECVQDDA